MLCVCGAVGVNKQGDPVGWIEFLTLRVPSWLFSFCEFHILFRHLSDS